MYFSVSTLLLWSRKHITFLLFAILFCFYLFLRFYHLFAWAGIGWDQVDSAWAAKAILIDHRFLIQGVPAKGNSGIFMGPLYYYVIAVFYFFTHLDLIASPIAASTMSIGGLLILFFVTKKLFNTSVALIAVFISTFSLYSIFPDRSQNAFGLIAPLSFLIFYFLYRTINGNEKSILSLAIVTGLSFHVDFTSVMYPFIILLALPFFPRTKKTLMYGAWGILIFLVFLSPTLFLFITHHSNGGNMFAYAKTNYHGLHLTRVLQLAHDAFISVEAIQYFSFLRPFVFLPIPLFMFLYYRQNRNIKSIKLFYLIALWFCIPWLILSTYSGELTDYYFSFPKYIVIAAFAYLTFWMLKQKFIGWKLIPIIFWGCYVFNSLSYFFQPHPGNLIPIEESVKQSIKRGEIIQFKDHDPYSYTYYVYTHR